MITDVFSVRTDMDQEEVARVVEKYNILAVPVVDEMNNLKGIITVDDIIDVLRQEATEDIYKMAGASEEELSTATRRSRSPACACRGCWSTCSAA